MNKILTKSVNWFIVLGLAAILIGCASIVSGTKQSVQLSSTPAAAKVKIERSVVGQRISVWEGSTPATVKLKRKFEYLVTISMEGYKTSEVALENGTNGWVWANLVSWGLIGIIVDFVNGSAKKLQPDEVNMQLVMSYNPQGEKTVYAVFQALDDNGQLRVLPVPLIPEQTHLSSRL